MIISRHAETINIKDSNEFSKILELNDEKYILTFKKTESEKIFITCESKDETISLYNYYIELSFQEFSLLGKSFRQCDDINDIFIFLLNVLNGGQIKIKTLKEMESNAELSSSNNDTIILNLEIPFFSQKYEKIKIEFLKKEKDLLKLYKKIREKYQKLKKIIYEEESENNFLYNKKSSNEFAKELIKEIEK